MARPTPAIDTGFGASLVALRVARLAGAVAPFAPGRDRPEPWSWNPKRVWGDVCLFEPG